MRDEAGSIESNGNRMSFIHLNTPRELTSGFSTAEEVGVRSYTYVHTNKVTHFRKVRTKRSPGLGDYNI